ncbi:MAG: preprotein translocase subunit SecG [Chitinispirillaceae bacterium]|nr:preprotein translocase subunit SecG [Chitinispirillaceae bacterium]
MMIIFWLLVVVFILVCILLCFFVLIQSDKGGGISGAIGGGLGGAQSLLGTQDTANFLTRATVGLSTAFLVLCVVMSVVVSRQTYTVEKSMLQQRAEKQQDYSPASVLGGGSPGLPIQEGAEGDQGAAQSPGLPVVPAEKQQAPAQSGTDAKTGGETQGLPPGAIPIGKPEPGQEPKK